VRRIVDRRFNRARYDADRIDWPIRFLAGLDPVAVRETMSW
jgi:hypothetical protein